MINILRDTTRLFRKSAGLEDFYYRSLRRYLKPNPHVDFILTPGEFLGRVKKELDPWVEERIKQRLDSGFNATALPPAGIADLKVSDYARSARALMAMPEHVNCDPAKVQSDFVFHFTRSAEAAGIKAQNFYTDDCTYQIKDAGLSSQRQNELRNSILQNPPDLVVFDGNFIATPEGITPGWWAALKKECPFKLVTVIADSYASAPDFLAQWGSPSDLSIIFSRRSAQRDRFPFPDRLLTVPGLPFAETSFDEMALRHKEIAISCIGSGNRNRREFCAMLAKTRLPAKIMLHDRQVQNAVPMDEYINILCRSKTVFNTGFVNDQTSIVTGRAIEAMLCKALLLEEDGTALSDYFIPWRHFVPVSNAHEMAIYAQFFAKHEEYRRRIVEEAFAMHRLHYSSKAFWSTVLNKLFPPH